MIEIPIVPCQIKELKISCFGCCGNNFSSKEKIEEDIRLNTEELLGLGKRLNSNKLMQFRDRFGGENALSENGLCYNFVDLGGCNACPLHNMVNHLKPKKFNIVNDKDLRIGHCDINEECETYKAWKIMTDDEKKGFILWLKKNNYDSYKYSIENGEERLYKKYKSEI